MEIPISYATQGKPNEVNGTFLPQKKSLHIDVLKYQELLSCPHLSDEDREKFLSAIWTIITAFIDLGFGIHPVQSAQEAGELYALCHAQFTHKHQLAA